MTMRLIDAEALEEKIENLITRFKALGRKQVAEDYNFALTVLSTAPTIESKPVVRAHWEQVITVVKKIHEYEQEDIQYRCDHCGHIVDDFENYCGGCGAQMFEGVKIPVISMEDVPKIMEEMEK